MVPSTYTSRLPKAIESSYPICGCGCVVSIIIAKNADIPKAANRSAVTTPPDLESGNQRVSVADMLSDKNHFFATYHFQIDPSSRVVKGHPQDTEITGGYNGSNMNEKAIGVTIGVDAKGVPFAKKEDEANHRYDDLCPRGQCGGVSRVPNLGNDYDIVWAADKHGNNVTYRGYAIPHDGSGREYLIANLMSDIDFTKQNTYLWGRSNQLGNTVPSGFITSGSYKPNGTMVVTNG